MSTLRHTRYQAAVIQDGSVLLLCCAFRNGDTAWMLPGGGREETEDELTCVVREVDEETGLAVRVERLLLDCPAQPPGGTYVRWRTYLCSVVSGHAAPGGGEGDDTQLVGVKWLSIDDVLNWPFEIRSDKILAPQLHAIRTILQSIDSASEPLATKQPDT